MSTSITSKILSTLTIVYGTMEQSEFYFGKVYLHYEKKLGTLSKGFKFLIERMKS